MYLEQCIDSLRDTGIKHFVAPVCLRLIDQIQLSKDIPVQVTRVSVILVNERFVADGHNNVLLSEQ